LRALDWLRAAGASRFYWKYCSTFDSTPEGNIGPVAEALMQAAGLRQAIYCPAFPENGRSVFMGTLFVGRQPLAESPMKDHPLTPMRDSNLMRLLAPQVTGAVGLVDRLTVARGAEAVRAELARLAVEGVAHVVVDAVADDDLRTIAAACGDGVLMTGGSALAMPLPALFAAEGLLPPGAAAGGSAPRVAAEAVVLSGSCSAMTNRQVAAYLAEGRPGYRLDPVTLAREGEGAARAWLAAQDLRRAPLIYATAEPEAVRRAQAELGTAEAGAVVERALAACAVAAREAGARRFVVAGGETSGAVTQALGVDRLDIGPEIAPGVPWCFCRSGGHPVALALKSGNFGGPEFFAEALARLEAA
jgi:3-dehydrotetronate 4-kinase